MDSLFIMNRYWGSDEENNEVKSDSDSSELSYRPCKKKKLDSSINANETKCIVKAHKNVKYSDHVDVIDEKTYYVNKGITECKKKSKKEKKCKSKIKVLENITKELNETNPLYIENSTKEQTEENSVFVKNATEKLNEANFTVEKQEKTNLLVENATEEQKETNLIQVDKMENFCTIGQVKNEKDIKIRHALPHWLSNPTYIGINLLEDDTPICELSYLDSNSKKNLENSGINILFPVQKAVIPWLMQSKEQSLLIRPSDICVSAPTGSGKTLAFVLPIVQSLKGRVVHAIRALVVLPVSELAVQVYKVFETFVKGTDLKVALLTGQKSFLTEQNTLVKANGQKLQCLVDIVVTTPGRIFDHIYRTKGFCLKRLRYLVIDEVDRMLEEIQQGWLKRVEDAVFNDCIFSNCVCHSLQRMSHEPSSAFNFGLITQPLQKLLYSATLTHDPEQLHNLSLYKPKLFTASSSDYLEACAIPPGLTMLYIDSNDSIKPMVMCHFIQLHNFKRVLCFTETVERAHRLHLVLEEMGILRVREISSSNTAVQRKIVLEQFSSGKVDVLVCSDLVARGIDIENIDCVISYDVPQSIKTYIHRIGRTARAGKTGTAVVLLKDGEKSGFKKMLESVTIKMPQKVNISEKDLEKLVSPYQGALEKANFKLRNPKKVPTYKALKMKKNNSVQK